jgi:hypothetical protein
MELSFEQVVILGLVATLVVQVIKWVLVLWKGVTLNKAKVSILVAVVSIGLAILFLFPTLSIVMSDPMDFVASIVEQAGAVVGLAYLIYVWLLKAIIDKLGLSEDALLARKTTVEVG